MVKPIRAIDADRIVKYLEEHAADPPVENPSILVRYALYQGLADRIKHGEFDIEKGP